MKKLIFIIMLSALSFLHAVYLHEGWDAGCFSANSWEVNPRQGNWQITNANGYHLRFAGYPFIQDYQQFLLSKELDISGVTNLNLKFAMLGIALEPESADSMAVEYCIDGSEWINIFSVVAYPGEVMDPLQLYDYDFPTPIAGDCLQLRFRAFGADSAALLFWRIDDILLTDQDYQAPATISGTITNSASEPVADALISDGFNYARSDYLGAYNIQVQPATSLTVTTNAFGYADAIAELTGLESDASTNHNFILQPEDPAIMDPYSLLGSVYHGENGVNVHLNWQGVHLYPDDGILELAYDTPPASYFYQPFMINECEYMVVKFEREWMLNVRAIKLALQSMMPTNVEIVAFYESDGMPDLNNPVFDNPQVFEFVPRVPGYPQWQQFPLLMDVPPQTLIYLGVKFQNGSLYSLGISPTDDSRTYFSYDSENAWEVCEGDAAMIRLMATEYEPWEQRNFLGYNVYRNHIRQNPSPLEDPFYYQESLPWGDNIFYVTAQYGNVESNISNSLLIHASELAINQVISTTPLEGAPYANIDIKAYQVRGGLNSLSLLRNGVTIFSETAFDPQQNLIQIMCPDYVLENDTVVQYQLEAIYLDGSVLQSQIYEYRWLMPPSEVSAIGCESGVQLSWIPPQLPNRDFLGYRIVKMAGGDYSEMDFLIQENTYTDTEVVFGDVYEYIVRAVYQDGFAESEFVQVVAGPPVYAPATNLSASVENGMVELTWVRPDDGYRILGKDSPGETPSPFAGENMVAYVHFAPGELMSYINHSSVGIAFIPETVAPVSIRVFNLNDPEFEFLCFETLLENPLPNTWNYVECRALFVEMIQNSYRVELETSAGLVLDNSLEPVTGANGIVIGDTYTDLFEEHGISQNWKFKIKFQQNEIVVPQTRGLYPMLTGYQVYKDGEYVSALTEFEEYYQEPVDLDASTSYYIVAEYDSGLSEPSNTVVVDPSSNEENVNMVVAADILNYPNPFNPSTRVSFNLNEAAKVNIQVYNVRGQLVKTLHNGPLAAGSHSLTWDGSDMNKSTASSGIYLLRLFDGKQTHLRKMCLQK